MSLDHDIDRAPDGTVLFIPIRLDKDPSVFRGMTSDEMFVVAGAGAVLGVFIGLFLMVIFSEAMLLIASILLIGPGIALISGGGLIRRLKRGKPNSWLYRRAQFYLATRGVPVGQARSLILRSGPWSITR